MRLRPIVMTGVTTIAGSIPLLLSSGLDFDDRARSVANLGQPLAVVLVVTGALFVLHVLCSRTLRGRRSRSALRRLAVASTITLSVTAGFATAVEVGAVWVRRHAATLTWENPEATVSELYCESGKPFALVKLMDRDHGSPAASYEKDFTIAEGLGPLYNRTSCAACHGTRGQRRGRSTDRCPAP